MDNKKQAVFLAVLAMAAVWLSFSPALYAEISLSNQGTAAGGYDAVAYFTDQKAVAGSNKYEYQWQGAKWLFASEEHRRMFMQAPEKYAPQYGGYCAFAVSKGSRAPADPHAWSVVNQKLYLNFNKQVQGLWKRDIENNIRKADTHWKQMQR